VDALPLAASPGPGLGSIFVFTLPVLPPQRREAAG